MKHHGKGNRKAQNERKRERRKHLPKKQPQKVELIDGNFSYYPVAYCMYHGAFITQGLAETHRCTQRNCRRYEMIGDDV